MEMVFDAPVAAVEGEEISSRGACRREAGQPIDDLGFGHLGGEEVAGAGELEDLLNAGPIQVLAEIRSGAEGADLAPTMSAIPRLGVGEGERGHSVAGCKGHDRIKGEDDLGLQGGVVALDPEEIVAPARQDLGGQGPLGVQGIGQRDFAAKIQRLRARAAAGSSFSSGPIRTCLSAILRSTSYTAKTATCWPACCPSRQWRKRLPSRAKSVPAGTSADQRRTNPPAHCSKTSPSINTAHIRRNVCALGARGAVMSSCTCSSAQRNRTQHAIALGVWTPASLANRVRINSQLSR